MIFFSFSFFFFVLEGTISKKRKYDHIQSMEFSRPPWVTVVVEFHWLCQGPQQFIVDDWLTVCAEWGSTRGLKSRVVSTVASLSLLCLHPPCKGRKHQTKTKKETELGHYDGRLHQASQGRGHTALCLPFQQQQRSNLVHSKFIFERLIVACGEVSQTKAGHIGREEEQLHFFEQQLEYSLKGQARGLQVGSCLRGWDQLYSVAVAVWPEESTLPHSWGIQQLLFNDCYSTTAIQQLLFNNCYSTTALASKTIKSHTCTASLVTWSSYDCWKRPQWH